MEAKNDGGPAFPCEMVLQNDYGSYGKKLVNGMSLRDWFAGQAMIGLLANQTNKETNDAMACIAYDMADQMLLHRRSPDLISRRERGASIMAHALGVTLNLLEREGHTHETNGGRPVDYLDCYDSGESAPISTVILGALKEAGYR